MKNVLKLIALILIALSSTASAQNLGHKIQIDDGLGHYSIITVSNPGGTFILPPSGGGQILTYTPGVSPAWLCGGNSNPISNILGTLSADDLIFQTHNITRVTFHNTPSATTPLVSFSNPTTGVQGIRIRGSLDAQDVSTLSANPGVWDLAVVGDEVVTGITKIGGSLWLDGSSSTHTITADKPLKFNTRSNDSIFFGTHDSVRMTIAKNGFVGIGTQHPVSAFHVSATPPDPAITSPAGFLLPDPFNHVMTVENTDVNGKANGIAIIIHSPSNVDLSIDDQNNDNRNNYMTFYNGNGDHTSIKGRIEGFSYQNYVTLKHEIDSVQNVYSNSDMYNPLNYFTFNVGYNSNWVTYNSDWLQFTPPTLPTFHTGSLPSLSWCNYDLGFTIPDVPWICTDDVGIPYPCLHDVFVGTTISYPCGISGGSWPYFSGGSIGSLSISSPFSFQSPLTHLTDPFSVNTAYIDSLAQEFKDFPYKQKLITAVTQPLVTAVDFGLSVLGSVTYESGSGDYAEWLERADHNEKIGIGDVVGIVGDKITKNTDGATHFMVASWKPCVLGNMPAAGKEEFFQKVAFMGQIPVKMMSSVKKGDYIIPDGHNNGFAKAISPENISAGDLSKVFGVAWDDAPETGIKLVKIAVGLKPHEMVKVIQDQEKQIGQLESTLSELDSLKAELDAIKTSLAQPAKLSKKRSKKTTQLSSN
jgi:hypothetical protein